jgi:hypothetical protein
MPFGVLISRCALQVFPREPPGVYVTLAGDEVAHAEDELAQMRARLPALGPALMPTCPCGRVHSRALELDDAGAVHGERVCAYIWLTGDEAGSRLHDYLGGVWLAQLIYDDSKQNGWVCDRSDACAMPCIDAQTRTMLEWPVLESDLST